MDTSAQQANNNNTLHHSDGGHSKGMMSSSSYLSDTNKLWDVVGGDGMRYEWHQPEYGSLTVRVQLRDKRAIKDLVVELLPKRVLVYWKGNKDQPLLQGAWEHPILHEDSFWQYHSETNTIELDIVKSEPMRRWVSLLENHPVSSFKHSPLAPDTSDLGKIASKSRALVTEMMNSIQQ
eukprot:TRINITY_DN11956_c0_g1_i1.p1 TRINITY_DN11956_c0_g1~~TRINITY_DN11956_c0_g1_i1.p1  ORF type:complete len:178 (+),score=32.63 TRINITY_DN11956_c0_g1_i1:161-694(+)